MYYNKIELSLEEHYGKVMKVTEYIKGVETESVTDNSIINDNNGEAYHDWNAQQVGFSLCPIDT